MKTPRLGNIYFIFVLCIILTFGFLIGGTVFGNAFFQLPVWIQQGLGELLFFLPPLLIYFFLSGRKISSIASFKKINFTNFGLIVLISFAVQPLSMTISAITSLFFPNSATGILGNLGMSFPQLLLTVAIIPAFFEEITMRGVVFSNYKDVPLMQAAVVNGFFFGIMHLSLQQFPYAFFMGIVFVYLVYYTRSVFASMLAHFMMNGTQVVLYTLLAMSQTAEQAAEVVPTVATGTQLLNEFVFLAVLCAIFLPVFAILMATFVRYNRRRMLDEALASETLPEEDAVLAKPKHVLRYISFWVVVVVFAYTLVLNFLG